MTIEKQKYYKVLTKDLKAPVDRAFSYENWQTKTFEVEGPLKMCKKGLHLHKSIENLSIGTFGERVFEAEPVGEYISSEDKICCKKIKLIKELNPEDIKNSEWAYYYCYSVEDKPGVYRNIIDSEWAYYYCHYIKDRLEVCKNITASRVAYWYCLYIEDKPEVYRHITNSRWAYKYCHEIKDRSEVHKNITNSEHV